MKKFRRMALSLRMVLRMRSEMGVDVPVCIFWTGSDYMVSPVESRFVQDEMLRRNHFVKRL